MAGEQQPQAMADSNGSGEHKLEHSWAFWEHRKGSGGGAAYGSNMYKLGDFDTVEDFWRFKNNIPDPSKVFFTTQAGRKRFADREVDGYSMFKSGIRPEWEDEANLHGGEFFCKRSLRPNELDNYWETMLLGLIGETIDPDDEVCGIRVVDKSKGERPTYRLELWFRSQDTEIRNELRQNLSKAIGADIISDYREHGPALVGKRGGGMLRHMSSRR